MLGIEALDGATVECAGALVACEQAAARRVRPELPAAFGSPDVCTAALQRPCADGHRPYSRLRLLLGRGPAVRLAGRRPGGRAVRLAAVSRGTTAIDAAYEAAAAAARADSAVRDAYEYARLGWLLEHVPELAECEPAHECVVELPGDGQWIEFEELDPGGTVCGARCQGAGTYGFGSAARLWPQPAASPQMTVGSPPCVLPWRASGPGRAGDGARCSS